MKKLLILSLVSSWLFAAEPPICERLKRSNFPYDQIADKAGAPASDMGVRMTNLVKEKSPNVLTSPWSVAAVLAQLELGARGATREELRQVLYGAKDADRAELMADANALLACPREYTSTVFRSANRIYVDKTVALAAPYKEQMERWFGTAAETLPLSTRAAESANTINGWVSQNTEKKIPELISPSSLTPATRAVLVNALYLRGTWAAKFEPSRTKKEDFTTGEGTKVKVPLMHLEGGMHDLRYAKMDGFEAVELPFADHASSMVVLLPPKGQDIAKLRGRLDAKLREQVRQQLSHRRVNLTLPRFKVSGSYQLNAPLQELGLKTTFEPIADFSGIDNGKHQVYVSAVIQKTVVDVNELGFEGAAATAAMMAAGAAMQKPTEPVKVVVNRPFLVWVEHPASGALLFLGSINDPR